jgi:transcriptional regulator NrdR family protein
MTRERKTYNQQSIDRAKGIKCPRCGCSFSWVNYTRQRGDGTTSATNITRRRECRRCGWLFFTQEVISLE